VAESPSRVDSSTQEQPSQQAQKTKGNFLLVPLVVTEPAIGEGLGGVLAYFHGESESKPRLTTGRNLTGVDRQRKAPPTVTGLFAMQTNNETVAVGLGHTRSLQEDRYRLTAAVANAQINARYYLADTPVRFSIEGNVVYANGRRRLGNSDVFLGLSTSVVDARAEFALGGNRDTGLSDFSFTDVGLAGSVIYDTRDDTMQPGSGTLVDFTAWNYGGVIGGDFDYWSAKLKFNRFQQLSEKFVLGWRFELGTADGDVPFYAEPFVSLRGIPALRYQGKVAGVAETELRYQFAERWSAIGFIGKGFVDARDKLGETDDDIVGYGVGMRFLALKKQNVWIGVDLARGPEEDAFYVQLSHPW
jgi:hypothetical protein